MKKLSKFKSLSRTTLMNIKGGGTLMKLRRSCGPNCVGIGAIKCSDMGCLCDGDFCGF